MSEPWDGLRPVPMSHRAGEWTLRNYPYVLAGAACVGLAASNGVRGRGLTVVALALLAIAGCVFAAAPIARVASLAVALALGGWWWGSARLDSLDSSVLFHGSARLLPRSRWSRVPRAAASSSCAFRPP